MKESPARHSRNQMRFATQCSFEGFAPLRETNNSRKGAKLAKTNTLGTHSINSS
jgi:hypothetical protein